MSSTACTRFLDPPSSPPWILKCFRRCRASNSGCNGPPRSRGSPDITVARGGARPTVFLSKNAAVGSAAGIDHRHQASRRYRSNGHANQGWPRKLACELPRSPGRILREGCALDLNLLTATAAARAIAAGEITAEDLIRSCLARIDQREPTVRAWVSLDPGQALSEARERDRSFARRGAVSPLHGIPVGIKDMIDTADLPTQHNSPIYRGHRPGQDAACVAVLRAAGAIILGKTETVEFAAGGRKAPTTNPHDRSCTPGGSSSGSAAAVADFQVPLAFGTQTGGSLIRPASFCGIFALKPSWGSVSREGAKLASLSFDTIGWYPRSIADPAPAPELFQIIDAPLAPPRMDKLRIAICPSPVFEHAAAETKAAISLGA